MASQQFTMESTAEQVVQNLDLSGQVIIVTGGANGLGKEASRVLASKGAHVIIAARNPARTETVAEEIRRQTANPKVDAMELDLSSFKSIRAFAAAFLARQLPLHVLLQNAAVAFTPELQLTEDGFELQFGTNHLGHFLLTKLLTDKLVASAPSRVVSVSSDAHNISGINWDDVNMTNGYHKWLAYGQSKTANILFANELNQRLAAKGVTAYSLHPGMIFGTGLGRSVPMEEFMATGMVNQDGTPNTKDFPFKSMGQGASTLVYASVHPDAANHAGGYFEDTHASQPQTEAARDAAGAQRLWELSETLIAGKA